MYFSGISSSKVLLSGEHSVVYGYPALATRTSKKVFVKLSENPDNNHKIYSDIPDDTGIILKAISLFNLKQKFTITVKSDIPSGCGLGSSAAIAIATLKAMAKYTGNNISKDELFHLAYECEKLAHGNPSGVDPASIIFGGLTRYIKGKPISSLSIAHRLQCLLINTGKPVESTKEMVELVSQRLVNHPKSTRSILNNFGELTVKIEHKLNRGEEITDLININGSLLEKLGVVSQSTIKLSEKLRSIGYGVKISGAGGVKYNSGILLCFGRSFDKAYKIADKLKMEYYQITIGE